MLQPWIDENKLLHNIDWTFVMSNGSYDFLCWLEKKAPELFRKHVYPFMSANPNAITLLQKYPNKISWQKLSCNSEALNLLEQHPHYIDWSELCLNPNPRAIKLLEQNPEEIHSYKLSLNPSKDAVSFLETHPQFIDWSALSCNPSAVHLLQNSPLAIQIEKTEKDAHNYAHKIHWFHLSANPNAVEILKENLDKVNLNQLSANPSWEAMNLFQQVFNKTTWRSKHTFFAYHFYKNPFSANLLRSFLQDREYSLNPFIVLLIPRMKIRQNGGKTFRHYMRNYSHDTHHDFWEGLSENPCKEALDLLCENPQKICWKHLSRNPAIFMTYADMKKKTSVFKEELMRQVYHPRRIARLLEKNFEKKEIDEII